MLRKSLMNLDNERKARTSFDAFWDFCQDSRAKTSASFVGSHFKNIMESSSSSDQDEADHQDLFGEESSEDDDDDEIATTSVSKVNVEQNEV